MVGFAGQSRGKADGMWIPEERRGEKIGQAGGNGAIR